jgi:hypothetical protein
MTPLPNTILTAFGLLLLQACTHGSGASAEEIALARFARTDLCCSITLSNYTETSGTAFGCGQQANYVMAANGWARDGNIIPGSGNPNDRLVDCTK